MKILESYEEYSEDKLLELTPLKQWYCNHCGRKINSVINGQIEVCYDEERKSITNIKIIHRQECCMAFGEEYERNAYHPLEGYLGEKGTGKFLYYYNDPKLNDKNPLIEIYKRTHLRYYEEAHQFLDQAFEDGYTYGPYWMSSDCPEVLKEIIKTYRCNE
jgi:hypothetical protein